MRWTSIGLAMYGCYILFHSVIASSGRGNEAASIDLLMLPSSLAACFLALIAASKASTPRRRASWRFFAFGYATWVLANLGWLESQTGSVVLMALQAANPLFVLLAHLLWLWGMLFYPAQLWDRASRIRLLLDTFAAAAASALLIWSFHIVPLSAILQARPAMESVALLYPVCDLALIVTMFHAYNATSRGVSRPPLMMLLAGTAAVVAGDLLRSFWYTAPGRIAPGIVASLWGIGAILAALSALVALRTSEDETAANADRNVHANQVLAAPIRNQLVLPYAALLLVILVQLIASSPTRGEVGAYALAAILLLAMFLRQTATIIENRRLNADLRGLDQLKSAFIANVSHELRTPLTCIVGYSELLLDETYAPLKPEQASGLRAVYDSALRLSDAVNEMLEVSDLAAGHFVITPTDVDPRPVLQQVADEMRLQASRKGLTLDTYFASNLPTVTVDAQRMAQAFANLLSNAVKFTPRGGTVRVIGVDLDLGRNQRAEQSHVILPFTPDLPRRRWLAVFVQDDGPGIGREDHQRLFGRFYRTPQSHADQVQGMGLGLYLARSIIEAHQGQIGLESQPGAGSTFWFALPAGPTDRNGFRRHQDVVERVLAARGTR